MLQPCCSSFIDLPVIAWGPQDRYGAEVDTPLSFARWHRHSIKVSSCRRGLFWYKCHAHFRARRHAVKSSSTSERNLTAMNCNEDFRYLLQRASRPPTVMRLIRHLKPFHDPSAGRAIHHTPSKLCDLIMDSRHTSGKNLQTACNDSTQLSISHLVIK